MSVHRMPPQDDAFDPRLAALAHAGMAERLAIGDAIPADGPPVTPRILAELANAVACGLVYVGDQIGACEETETVTLTPVHQGAPATITRLVKALTRIRDHEEQGSPPDGEMREIAREALRIGYPASDEEVR